MKYNILTLENISLKYGETYTIKDINLSITNGDIVA